MKPLVSIIVPVYKVEKYLDRCVESLVNQTYKNIEIILVDDGSPDNCPEMCDAWAHKDSRIVVIHKENGGLSDARNKALDIINGEYVFFVDSDDFISNNAIDTLLCIAIQENSSVVISERLISFSDKILQNNEYTKNYYTVDSYKALEVVFCKNTRWEAWGTLYRSELFNKVRFPFGKIYEDISTFPKILLESERVTFVDIAIYYYFLRPDSIMRGNEYIVKYDLIDAVNEIWSTICNTSNIHLINAKAGVLNELSSRIHFARKDKNRNIKFINDGVRFLKKNIIVIFKSNKICIKEKLFIFLVMLNLSNKIWK